MSIKEIEEANYEGFHPFGPTGPFVWIAQEVVTLDGNFTVAMLESIVAQMKGNGNE